MSKRVIAVLVCTLLALVAATVWVPFRPTEAFLASLDESTRELARLNAQTRDDLNRLLRETSRIAAKLEGARAQVERLAGEVETRTGEAVPVPSATPPVLPTPPPIASPPKRKGVQGRRRVVGYGWVWHAEDVDSVSGVAMYEVVWSRVVLTHTVLLLLGGALLTLVVRRERGRRAVTDTLSSA